MVLTTVDIVPGSNGDGQTMLITTAEEPRREDLHHEHLVLIVWNAESHGLTRVDPKPFKCDCGATLTADALDCGDELKTSWPRAASWRGNGKKKCPECEDYPTIRREQYFRARGYGATPKSDIKRVTPKQREEALEEADYSCYVCDDEAEYVKRIIPRGMAAIASS